MLAALTLAAIITLPTPYGVRPCGATSEVIAGLAEKYGEVAYDWTRGPDGGLLLLYVSPGGTWTILSVAGDGALVCMAKTGKGYRPGPRGGLAV